jgi:hypothetical protein
MLDQPFGPPDMIRYALTCDRDHAFESWFQSATAWDRLSAAGHVACAVCGSTTVTKALMAPAVQQQAKPPEPAALTGPRNDAEQALAALRARIEAESDYVGLSFASQARAMHLGDMPERPIHGEARPDEARALLEDGVPIAPLPFLPRAKAN